MTAPIAAAYRNHVEVAKLVIKAGADVNFQDNHVNRCLADREGTTPLAHARVAAVSRSSRSC